MIEQGHISAWRENSEERIASTVDIRSQLRSVKPNSFDEYVLCFEAALDRERPLSERERYLLARYGSEYAKAPDKFHQEFDDLQHRANSNVDSFVLIEHTPKLAFVGRLASPNLKFVTRLSGFGKPYGALGIELDSVIWTVLNDRNEITYELTRDFVDIGKFSHMIEEGTTTHNLKSDGKGGFVLDSEKPFIHEGNKFGVFFGFDEIMTWEADHPEWEEHVENMIKAWNTKLINYPVAKKMPFESALDHLKK